MKKEKLEKAKLGDIFRRFGLESINLSTNSASVVLTYTNWDAEAAWQLYVELLTRVTTQKLEENEGDLKTALESIYKLFDITRNILKDYGRNARCFTRIAIIILNLKIRPFTSKWHRKSLNGEFEKDSEKNEFRKELDDLRIVLICYARMLADMAKVDDLTNDCIN